MNFQSNREILHDARLFPQDKLKFGYKGVLTAKEPRDEKSC